MAAEFVSLADLLLPREPSRELELAAAPHDVRAPDDVVCELPDAAAMAVGDALREARLFRARLADAFDDAAARLLRELAADVLARELRLAPCDLEAIVRRVRERIPLVRVRVAPADVARMSDAPVVADPLLAAGDAVVELAGGALDARLGVRLASVLEAFA